MADIKRFIQNWDYYVFGNASSQPRSIVLDKSEITFVSVGQTSQLTATVLPSTAVDKSVTWSSSDTSIATVDNTWLVTCVSLWDCTITATTSNWLTATCAVAEAGGYTPTADTLIYFPLNSTYTYTDQSWNALQATNYNVTFWTNYWVDCGKFDTTTRIIITSSLTLPTNATFLCWCYLAQEKSNYDQKIFDMRSSSNYFIPYYYCGWVWGSGKGYWIFTTTDHYINNSVKEVWVLYYAKRNWSSVSFGYKWGATWSMTTTMYSGSITESAATIWNEHNSTTDRHFIGWLSELILEKRQWTDTEITDYYNLTKAKYWF